MFRDTSVNDLDPTLPTSAPVHRRCSEDVAVREPVTLVVVCFVCRAFRDDVAGAWSPAHARLSDPRPALTHGLCPSCLERLYPDAPGAERAPA